MRHVCTFFSRVAFASLEGVESNESIPMDRSSLPGSCAGGSSAPEIAPSNGRRKLRGDRTNDTRRCAPTASPACAGSGAWFRPGGRCSQSEARRTSFRQIGTYVKQLANSFYLSKCISFYLWLSEKMTLVGCPSSRQANCKGGKKRRKQRHLISMCAS